MGARRPTEKQRRFVEAYMGQAAGNATEAARLAGYSGSSQTLRRVGCDNLTKPHIREAIAELQAADPLVAGRKQIQQYLTAVMLDSSEATGHRLKAAEILGRSQGLFLERVEHSGYVSFAAPQVMTRKDAEELLHRYGIN